MPWTELRRDGFDYRIDPETAPKHQQDVIVYRSKPIPDVFYCRYEDGYFHKHGGSVIFGVEKWMEFPEE